MKTINQQLALPGIFQLNSPCPSRYRIPAIPPYSLPAKLGQDADQATTLASGLIYYVLRHSLSANE
jgi:hypothetical protein